MTVEAFSIAPPAPTMEDFIVQVAVRQPGGLIKTHKLATNAGDEETAKWSAVRHLGLNLNRGMERVVSITVRRRWQTGARL